MADRGVLVKDLSALASGATYTLTVEEAKYGFIKLTGSVTGTVTIAFPRVPSLAWHVWNAVTHTDSGIVVMLLGTGTAIGVFDGTITTVVTDDAGQLQSLATTEVAPPITALDNPDNTGLIGSATPLSWCEIVVPASASTYTLNATEAKAAFIDVVNSHNGTATITVPSTSGRFWWIYNAVGSQGNIRIRSDADSGYVQISPDYVSMVFIENGQAVAIPFAQTFDASSIISGTMATARLGSGTASSSTFLRGDNTWQTPAGLAPGAHATTHASGGSDAVSLAASQITSGALALARGGTNADLSASGGTTKILAQDASHVVSARDLVAGDIPNLDAGKITTGTMATARLGSSGTANSGTYLRGDQSWAAVSAGATISTGAAGSEPGSPATGDLYFPNNAPQIERYSGSAWKTWGPIFPLVAPVSGNFTWVNQGGATLTDNKNSLSLHCPAPVNSHNLRGLLVTAPATPYTVTAFLDCRPPAGNAHRWGLFFRESSTGKTSHLEYDAAGVPTLYSVYWSSVTTPTTAYSGWSMYAFYNWFQISDDGANRTMRVSVDGQNWEQVDQQSRTLNMTADQVGWFGSSYNGNPIQVVLHSWAIT